VHVIVLFFFFSSRRRHTRLQGDWSSDVCSSDLAAPSGQHGMAGADSGCAATWQALRAAAGDAGVPWLHSASAESLADAQAPMAEIGRGSWRGRGEISGGGRSLKKKKKKSSMKGG